MIQKSCLIFFGVALALLILSVPVGAQSKKAKSTAKPSPAGQVETDGAERSKLQAEVMRTMAEYKESLRKLLAIHESNLRRITEQAAQKRAMYEKGFLSRGELEWSERELEQARADLEGTRRKLAQADVMAQMMITETLAHESLLRPLPARGYSETKFLIRYNGPAKWALSDAAKIESFYLSKFGRALPVSAFGQTAVHDQMKFDHRNAIDVAVHPDSREGRALMAYLRNAGIPFVAFRNAVPGSATGAHIHVGKMSSRGDGTGGM